MSRGTFNGAQSPDVFDHGLARLRAENDARRREIERQERAEQWIAGKMAGLTFHSFESLVETIVRVVETVSGPMSDDQRRVATNAARALYAGLVLRDRTSISIDARGRVERITFNR